MYIADASFLISLAKAELEGFLSILEPVVVPDLVFEEVKHQREAIARLNLRIVELFDTSEVIEVMARFKGLSYQDAACIVSAKAALQDGKSPVVLTGDGPLRKACEIERLRVHGVLWFFDLLHEKEVLEAEVLCRALQKLLREEERLPQREVAVRLRMWCR